MKLDINKFPLLWSLENGVISNVNHAFANWQEDDGRVDMIKGYVKLIQIWPLVYPRIRQNVLYLCDSYMAALDKSSAAFDKALFKEGSQEIADIIKNSSGCFTTKSSQNLMVQYAWDFCDDHIFVLVINSCDTLQYFRYSDIKGRTEFITSVEKDIEKSRSKIMHRIMLFCMMEKYAKVETKIIWPGAKFFGDSQKKEKIINQTRLKIKFRDCSWFTTICRNEGFTVSGHFRLQPKKINGEWTREMIYINSFEKHGYHRSARILEEKQKNNDPNI